MREVVALATNNNGHKPSKFLSDVGRLGLDGDEEFGRAAEEFLFPGMMDPEAREFPQERNGKLALNGGVESLESLVPIFEREG